MYYNEFVIISFVEYVWNKGKGFVHIH